MPVQMYQFGMCPHNATSGHNKVPMSMENQISSSNFFTFGQPVEIRKATTAPDQKTSEVTSSDTEFLIQLELRGYLPGEVKVTSDKHQITITAKQEMKDSSDGCVSRTLTHVYNLPKGVDPKSVTAAMNSQGFMIIRAPKSTVEATVTH